MINSNPNNVPESALKQKFENYLFSLKQDGLDMHHPEALRGSLEYFYMSIKSTIKDSGETFNEFLDRASIDQELLKKLHSLISILQAEGLQNMFLHSCKRILK